MKKSLQYKYIMNYYLRTQAFLCLLFVLAPFPVNAGERVGHPTEGLFVVVGTMYGCTQTGRDDLNSHCYVGLVSGTWGTIFTKNPWLGFGVGCGITLLKEVVDHNKWLNENSFADEDDAKIGCGAAAISSYGTNSLLKFYSIRNTPMVGVNIPLK